MSTFSNPDCLGLHRRIAKQLHKQCHLLWRKYASWLSRKPDAGTAVVEYAIVTVAACALGAVLFKVVTGGELKKELLGIFLKALRVSFGG